MTTPTPSAAALTEQIAELLADHVLAFSAGRCACSCGSFERVWHYDNGKASHKDHRTHIADVLAARLADSRLAVGEAAGEAAAEALWLRERRIPWAKASTATRAYWLHDARAALSAALQHMGDGKA